MSGTLPAGSVAMSASTRSATGSSAARSNSPVAARARCIAFTILAASNATSLPSRLRMLCGRQANLNRGEFIGIRVMLLSCLLSFLCFLVPVAKNRSGGESKAPPLSFDRLLHPGIRKPLRGLRNRVSVPRHKIMWRDRKLAQPIVVRNGIEAAGASFFRFCDLDQIGPAQRRRKKGGVPLLAPRAGAGTRWDRAPV